MREIPVTEVANINIDDAILVRQCWQGDSAAIERQNRPANIA
jgi:hypothetical protein